MTEKELSKYATLANWIKEQIANGTLKHGDKLYSENELRDMFHLSRQTARQAVSVLEQDGVVERRRGSGTYILNSAQEKHPPTMNIGVISTYMDSYIFPKIMKGIETVLSANGYAMQLSLTHNQVENEARALQAMLDKHVDGLIVEPTKSALPNLNLPLYTEIYRKKIPLIFFNAYYEGTKFPHVCMDDLAAGKMATTCLLDAGHRHIAGMFQSDDRQGHLRYNGYVSALSERGIEVRSGNILWFTTEDISYIAEDFARIKRCLQGCTGLVCYNDKIACGIAAELRKNGIFVPDDLSLVGIDDAEIAALCEVPLTSIRHPKEELGKTVAQNMLKKINNPKFNATATLEPSLVQRCSVKTIKLSL